MIPPLLKHLLCLKHSSVTYSNHKISKQTLFNSYTPLPYHKNNNHTIIKNPSGVEPLPLRSQRSEATF